MSDIVYAEGDMRDEILAVEARRQAALIAKDLDALDVIFDETLVHVHAPGEVHTKELLLEHVSTRGVYLEITRGELDVRVIGDAAVVTGSITNRMKAPGGGERTLSGEVTQVLRRDDSGEWKFVSFQMTPYGDKAWGRLPSQQNDTLAAADGSAAVDGGSPEADRPAEQIASADEGGDAR